MPRVFVSVGSNVKPEVSIARGLEALEDRFGPITASATYESRAVGFEGRNFLNLVVAFRSDEDPGEIHRSLRRIEDRAGRRRDQPKLSDRTLDLDLLLYGDAVLRSEELELPRGEILEYAFVLRPLAELAPTARHPELGLTYRELWEAFDDSEQALWPAAGGRETP